MPPFHWPLLFLNVIGSSLIQKECMSDGAILDELFTLAAALWLWLWFCDRIIQLGTFFLLVLLWMSFTNTSQIAFYHHNPTRIEKVAANCLAKFGVVSPLILWNAQASNQWYKVYFIGRTFVTRLILNPGLVVRCWCWDQRWKHTRHINFS